MIIANIVIVDILNSCLSVTPFTETPVQFAISVKLTGIARRNFLRNFIINFLENLKRCCFLSKLISSLKYCDQTFSREIDIKLKALWRNVSWKIKSSLRAAQNVSKVYGMFLAVFLSLRVIKFVYCLKFNSIIWDLYHKPVVEFDEKHFESPFFVKCDFWAYFAQTLISLCSCITKYFTFCEFAQISKHFNQKPWARKGTYLTGTGEEHFELA